jgi:hypothetical protein
MFVGLACGRQPSDDMAAAVHGLHVGLHIKQQPAEACQQHFTSQQQPQQRSTEQYWFSQHASPPAPNNTNKKCP